MCSRNTVSESLHTSFFCDRDPFCKVVRRPENTHGMFAWVTRWSLPSLKGLENLSPSLERPADFCLQSKIRELIFSFQVPCGSMKILHASRIFLFMAGYRNLHTSGFFPVICWSYLQTEISVTLSLVNKLFSRHHILYFSFLWKPLCSCHLPTALNHLSSFKALCR